MGEIVMPRLSDSMEEGTILRWLVDDGASVTVGQEIVEIETDKATMPYEADEAGVLTIGAPEGSTVPVGAPIGAIGERLPAASANGNGVAVKTRDAVNASPVARRVAERLGVALGALVGSGPYGRVLKADVVAAADAPAPAVAPTPVIEAPQPVAPAPPVVAPEPVVASAGEELSRTQQLIARRMAESRATVPDFALEVEVDMSSALELRARLKELSDAAPSVNDFVVKAGAVALRRHPRANGSYKDGRFELHDEVNVGVAVAAPDTLVVPVVRNADGKSLGAIAGEVRAMAARVRDGAISAPELSGGTFTVSNLGMFGIDRFEGIINVPQAAILCVGAIRDRVVAVDGAPAVRPIMSMTLASDHRILYGADAAQFLTEIRTLLESPLTLAL
jgi:pyruvate dehydrogenase E2 component (dihydrolipoamide acetyltransferase)